MPELPPLPAGYRARPLTADDVDAVAAVLAAAEKVDDTGEHSDADELSEQWVNELVDLASDGLAVSAGDGDVVAYATAIAPPTFRGAFAVYLDGRVHPEQRGQGIGRALLAWQLARGAEVHEQRHPGAPARLVVTVPDGMPALEALVRRAGLAPTRWYQTMQRPLTGLPERGEVTGVDLVPFDWDRDDEVRRAHNAAFVEHHGSSERDRTSWQVLFTGRDSFRPDLSVLALADDDGAVVAYALVYVQEAHSRATGVRQAYFGQIGTLPAFRGRGLASATITAALRAAADAGCGTAELQVDSENTTGAARLYEALGFRTRHRDASWTRHRSPVASR